MRSFIGWIGGKSHLKNQIISLIPGDCERYIEVCGGAGWVLFGKDKIKGQMEIFIGYNLESCFLSIAMRLRIRLSLLTCKGQHDIFT